MEKEMKNKRRLVIATTLLATVLILGMNVSATVQYAHVKKLTMDTIEQKIDKIVNSTAYQRLYNFVHPKFIEMYNTSSQQAFYERMLTNMSPYFSTYFGKDGPLYPGLVAFLQTVGESIMVLFGHGVVGIGTATMVVISLGLLASILIGIVEFPRIGFSISFVAVAFCLLLIDDIMIYNLGIIGTLIFITVMTPLIALFLLFAIPIADVLWMIVVFVDTTDYV